MSGPIIRQYGVPNWDEIFGKKDEHDANAERQQQAKAEEAAQEEPRPDADDDELTEK